jgi:nitroimidazol reductase NimA-like FMN-containing flavoprotein (pyridoxamine 5'-phosphate oxidase superfamily)
MARLTNDMKRVVDEQRLGFVATVDADGTPNLSPKGTIAVLDDDHLVFADLASPHTVENLRRDPSVEINVVDVVTRTGYRFKGRAEVVGEGERFERLLNIFSNGARAVVRPRERIHHFVVVDLDRCQPLRSPAYDLGATEAETAERWERYFTELWASRRDP